VPKKVYNKNATSAKTTTQSTAHNPAGAKYAINAPTTRHYTPQHGLTTAHYNTQKKLIGR